MAYEEGTGRISAKVTHEQGVKRRRAARANVRFTNEDQADSVESSEYLKNIGEQHKRAYKLLLRLRRKRLSERPDARQKKRSRR